MRGGRSRPMWRSVTSNGPSGLPTAPTKRRRCGPPRNAARRRPARRRAPGSEGRSQMEPTGWWSGEVEPSASTSGRRECQAHDQSRLGLAEQLSQRLDRIQRHRRLPRTLISRSWERAYSLPLNRQPASTRPPLATAALALTASVRKAITSRQAASLRLRKDSVARGSSHDERDHLAGGGDQGVPGPLPPGTPAPRPRPALP